MDKREKMLALIDPSREIGLEIGPLDIPIVTREMGRVRYVDHASTEELKVKNRENPFVKVDRIAEVDYVWGAKSLPELVADETPFDYVVASHVIEHVPDLVGWLGEIRAILRPRGVLSLAIPDKRFCFDYFRQPTTAADVLEAFLRRDRTPGFRQIFDHLATFATLDGALTWGAGSTGTPSRKMTTRQAWDIARGASTDGTYHDVHCWVFTPATFFQVLATLIELDLFGFRVATFFPPTGHEFFVSLRTLEIFEDREEARAVQLESLPTLDQVATNTRVGSGQQLVSLALRYLRRSQAVARRVLSSRTRG